MMGKTNISIFLPLSIGRILVVLCCHVMITMMMMLCTNQKSAYIKVVTQPQGVMRSSIAQNVNESVLDPNPLDEHKFQVKMVAKSEFPFLSF
jgi:hypothetical protein